MPAAPTRARAAKSRPASRRGGPAVDAAAQLRVLKRLYPGAHCSLDYQNPYQLLVATILSAQCTDERVNMVTPDLFRQYPTPHELSQAEQPELEIAIRSTGFFRSKARALRECSRDVVEKHGGDVPRTMDELTGLRGVGRKTANVVLGNAYGLASGVVVDTHVGRVSRRLGLTRHTDPVKVELDLMERIPKRDWVVFSHLLIYHGRAICRAPRALCQDCRLAALCPKIGVPPALKVAATPFLPGVTPKAAAPRKRAAR